VVVTEEAVALEVVDHGPRRGGVCEERMLALYMLVKRDRRGEGTARRRRGRWTEERCVWHTNGKERAQGASAKETQSAMVTKWGGRTQRNIGKRRGRMDTEGQDCEGKREVGDGGKDGDNGNEKTGSSMDEKGE
jgi:hypothetical protein